MCCLAVITAAVAINVLECDPVLFISTTKFMGSNISWTCDMYDINIINFNEVNEDEYQCHALMLVN